MRGRANHFFVVKILMCLLSLDSHYCALYLNLMKEKTLELSCAACNGPVFADNVCIECVTEVSPVQWDKEKSRTKCE